jgi:hypothetical protein
MEFFLSSHLIVKKYVSYLKSLLIRKGERERRGSIKEI